MITTTSTGLRHTATQGFYSGEVAETGVVPTTVKRGRGRPSKNVSESGAKFDFSAFVTPVKLAPFKGARVFTKLSK